MILSLLYYIISIILSLSSSLPLNLDKSKVARRFTFMFSDNGTLKDSLLEKKEIALTLFLLISEKVISKCSPDPFLPNFLIFSIFTFSKRKIGLGLASPKGASFSISRQFFIFTILKSDFISKIISFSVLSRFTLLKERERASSKKWIFSL